MIRKLLSPLAAAAIALPAVAADQGVRRVGDDLGRAPALARGPFAVAGRAGGIRRARRPSEVAAIYP